MHVGFKTDKGILRSSNEDACFVLLHDKVYILADGVGGGNSGEIASRTAVSEIANYVVNHPLSHLLDKYEIVGYMRDAFEAANTKIYDMARKHEENFGMATTAIIVYVNKGKAYIGNIGDSRVYLYRNGDYLQLTEEKSLADLRSSLIANPRNSDALFRLYELYYAKQDYRKAQYYLRQVVAINPNDSSVRKLNEALTQLVQ